jgi:hypothetical protein
MKALSSVIAGLFLLIMFLSLIILYDYMNLYRLNLNKEYNYIAQVDYYKQEEKLALNIVIEGSSKYLNITNIGIVYSRIIGILYLSKNNCIIGACKINILIPAKCYTLIKLNNTLLPSTYTIDVVTAYGNVFGVNTQ